MSLSILEKPAIRKRVPAISIEGYHELFRLGFIKIFNYSPCK